MRALVAAIAVLTSGVASGQEATYLVRGGSVPEPRVANGYVQHVTPRADGAHLVQVSAGVTPVGSDGVPGRFRPSVVGERGPERSLLPRSLQTRLTPDLDAWEAATRIVEHVMDTVRYLPDDRGPQDAESVLARREGRCSGIANAAVGLLRSAGFEARTVSGLLVADGRTIPHRWLECRLPAAGWVGCDPTLGLWVMTSSHLAFARPVESLPEIERLAGGDPDLTVLPRRGRWPVRPNRGALLSCRTRSPVDGASVRLVGPWNEVRRSVLDGDAEFAGLLPGTWRLEVLLGERVVQRLQLQLEGDRPHVVLVDPTASPPGRDAGAGAD